MSQTSPSTQPSRLLKHETRFSVSDIEAANRSWRATCGPVALACITNLTLDEVRPHIGNDYRGWMNPTQMQWALASTGVNVSERNRDTLYRPTGKRQYGCPMVATYGITRIQFDGPWCADGVPPSAAYRYTHWVASSIQEGEPCVDVFDNNWGWMSLGEFIRNMPELAKESRGATGQWWPTHIYEISFPGEPLQALR